MWLTAVRPSVHSPLEILYSPTYALPPKNTWHSDADMIPLSLLLPVLTPSWWLGANKCSSMHTASSNLLVAGEEIPALGDSWIPWSSPGNSEKWLEPLTLVTACYLWSLLAQRGWNLFSTPGGGGEYRWIGSPQSTLLSGEAGGRSLGQQPVSSQLVAATTSKTPHSSGMFHLGHDAVLDWLPLPQILSVSAFKN